MLPTLGPGDVLVVRTPDRRCWDRAASYLIRLGAALRDRPNLDNHVAVYHHTDAAGTPWGIEGRPGGVGWVDLRQYDNPWLLTNAAQPKTDAQRHLVCQAAVGLLGVGYDWAAIGMDTADALGLDHLWRVAEDWGAKPPGHVVCSSLAAWAYQHADLDRPPGRMMTTTPGDWSEFILTHTVEGVWPP